MKTAGNTVPVTDPSGENWVTRNAAGEAGGVGDYGAPQGNCTTAVQCAAMYNTTAPLVTKAEAIAISQQPGAGCWAPKGSCSGAVVGNAMAGASGSYGLSTAAGYASAFIVGGSSAFIGGALVYGGAIDYGAAAVGVSLLGVLGVVTGGVIIATGAVAAGLIINEVYNQ